MRTVEKKLRHKLRWSIAAVCVALWLLGCSESDSGLPLDDGSDGIGSTASGSGQGVNGDLRGSLFAVGGGEPFRIDLSSGLVESLPMTAVIDWFDRQGLNIDSDRNFLSVGGSTRSEFLQTYPNCYVPGTRPKESCVVLYNDRYESRRLTQLNDRHLQHPGRLSRSGDRIAYSVHIADGSDSLLSIEVVDIETGSLEHTAELPVSTGTGLDYRSGGPAALDWGVNGELVYANPYDPVPTIYVTQPGTLRTHAIWRSGSMLIQRPMKLYRSGSIAQETNLPACGQETHLLQASMSSGPIRT